jgi:hypothetical protein
MQGGVDRYTHNLVKSLRSNNLDVVVISSSDGSGDYVSIRITTNVIPKCY